MNINHQSQTPRKPTNGGTRGSPNRRRSQTTKSGASSSSSRRKNIIKSFCTLGIGIAIGSISALTLSHVLQNEYEFRNYLSTAINFDENYVELQTLLHNSSISSVSSSLSAIASDIILPAIEDATGTGPGTDPATDLAISVDASSKASSSTTSSTAMENSDVPKVVSSTSVVTQSKEGKTPSSTTTEAAAAGRFL